MKRIVVYLLSIMSFFVLIVLVGNPTSANEQDNRSFYH